MRKCLLLLLFITSLSVCAQEFCVVQDDDGFVNVRSHENKIIDRLSNGKPVWVFEPSDGEDWFDVDYSKGEVSASGKIHKSRLKPISEYEKIPIKEIGNNFVLLENEYISIRVVEKKFKETEHTYLCQNGFALYLSDYSRVWGTDGTIPTRQYESFNIKIKGENVILPAYAFRDLCEPTLDYTTAYYDKESKILYLTSMNSDGAGGYVVLWLFRNGIFEDRLLTLGF